METGGRATLRYEPGGVVCDVFLPPSSLLSRNIMTSVSTRAVHHASQAGGGERPYRILVVEDSFLVVTLLEEIFQALGWQSVGPATRLADALLLASTGVFDAALLDVNLNGELSWDVARVLSERGVPFVFSTGYNIKTVLPAHLAGTAVISKPFRPTGVLSTLILARSVHGYEQRLLSKVSKLEETLRSRRVIERAVKLLAERRGINDVQAYDHIRRQATNKRVSIVEVASMIINASDVLDGMGPVNR